MTRSVPTLNILPEGDVPGMVRVISFSYQFEFFRHGSPADIGILIYRGHAIKYTKN